MKILKKKGVLLVILSIAYSQSFAQFEISKHSINNGGGQSSSSSFSVSGSIGQIASTKMSGDNFSVTGGFWSASQNLDIIFKNGFEN